MISKLQRLIFTRATSQNRWQWIVRNGFYFVLSTYLSLPVIGFIFNVNINKYFSEFSLFGDSYSLDLPFEILGVLVVLGVGAVSVILDRERCRNLFWGTDGPSPSTAASFSPERERPPISMPRRFCMYMFRHVHIVLLTAVLAAAYYYYQRGIVDNDFSNDEFQVIDTAYGYLQTGHFKKWDFCTGELSRREYLRAFPHTWLVSKAISWLGMSEWSTRLVSVLFGVLSILLVYFIAEFFIRDRLLSLLLTSALVLQPGLSVLFRITRMYSMLVPCFLVLFFCVHKVIVAISSDGIGTFRRPRRLLLLVVTVLSTGLCAAIHINSLIVFPATFFLVLLLGFVTDKTVFRRIALAAAIVGVVLVVVSLKLGFHKIFTNHMSLFGSSNTNYFQDLFRFPLGISVGAAICLLSVLTALMSKKQTVIVNTFSLFSISLVGGLFFVFVADRYYAFKYISFLVPISIIWIFYSVRLVVRLQGSRWKKYFLYLLVSANVLLLLPNQKHSFRNASFQTVYSTIRKNYEPQKKELIAGLFLRCYYLKGIGNKAALFPFKKDKKTSYREFVKTISKFPSGWITWEAKKRNHVDPRVIKMASTCFRKLHGTGVDRTKIDLYYYDQDMPCMRKRRGLPRRAKLLVNDGREIPSASMIEGRRSPTKPSGPKKVNIEIDLASAFTVSFWVKSKSRTPGAPISFGESYRKYIGVESRKDIDSGGFRFRYKSKGTCSSVSTGKINDRTWHWVALYQTGGDVGDEIGVYVDGKKVDNCRATSTKSALSRFLINRFNGKIQDVRIYESVLSPSQISAVYNNNKITLSSQLYVQGEGFMPKYHLVF